MMLNPGKTERVSDKICVIRTVISNFYIYDAGEELIAFDTGMAPPFAGAGMRKLGLDPGRVGHVFLTHSDMDHVGGLGLFKNARIFLSEAEVPLVTGEKARRFMILQNRRLRGYTALADGETVSVGSTRVECVSAPGHTLGSACYVVDDEAVATGDLLRIRPDGGIISFSVVQNMNHAQNRETLARLQEQGVLGRGRYLLTGHSGAYDRNRTPR